jgi:type IV pilus assembly protein PilA
MRRGRGFSLIELLVVIAIILALAALAIPNLMRSKISANEASAVSSLRTIATAQTTYAVAYPNLGYADALTKLAAPQPGYPVGPNSAGLLDWVLGCASQPCPKAGYLFAITNPVGSPVAGYTVNATPQLMGQTGRRGFCGDQVPRIMVDENGGTNCTATLQ